MLIKACVPAQHRSNSCSFWPDFTCQSVREPLSCMDGRRERPTRSWIWNWFSQSCSEHNLEALRWGWELKACRMKPVEHLGPGPGASKWTKLLPGNRRKARRSDQGSGCRFQCVSDGWNRLKFSGEKAWAIRRTSFRGRGRHWLWRDLKMHIHYQVYRI